MDTLRQIAELEAALRDRDAQVAALLAQVAALTAQVERLTEELGRNSRNSNRPPSSDPPGRGQKRRTSKKKKRKRGGQPGHKGSRRELLPTDDADDVIHLFPDACENCWQPLPQTHDPRAKRYQVTELLEHKPHLTEYQRHAVRCACGYVTRRPFKDCGILASPFGPRLTGAIAMLTGVYHLSRRKAAQLLAELMGVRISIGAISAIEARVSRAVAPAVAEARARVADAPIKHTDGSVPRRHAQQPKGRRSKPCCMNDEGWPLGIGMQVQVPNHHELLGSRAQVVSVDGKGVARPRQVWSKKTSESEPLMTCRDVFTRCRNWVVPLAQDEPRRCLLTGWAAFGIEAA